MSELGDDERQGAEAPRSPKGARELATRVVTAVVLAGLAAGFFAAGRGPAVAVVTIIAGVGAFELYEAFRRAGHHVATALGVLGSLAVVPIAYEHGPRAFPMVLFLVLVFTVLWYLVEVVHTRPAVNVALTLFGFVYVGCLGAFGALLLGLSGDGVGFLLGPVICAIGSDSAAYFVGANIGRTKLLPRVSPNKTVEGLVASVVASLSIGAAIGELLHPWADGGVGHGLALGLVVAVTAPLGDLCESMVKRDLKVKDLSSAIPAHGGVLDMFDSLLLALPATYYLALHLFG